MSVGTSPSICAFLSICIVDVENFIKQTREYAHLVTQDAPIVNLPELKAIEKRIVSRFIVGKKLNKIIKTIEGIRHQNSCGHGHQHPTNSLRGK